MRNASRAAGRWILFGALLAAATVLAWKAFPVTDWLRAGVGRVEGLGIWGVAVWLACFALLGTLGFPVTPLHIASGVLFGFECGTGVGFAAALLSAACSFLVARHLARGAWERWLSSSPRFESLLGALEEESFKVVVLARLSPFLPAAVKNYGFGLTAISFRRYLAATAVVQIPIAATYAYLGWAGGTAVLAGEQEVSRVETILLVCGAVASLAVLTLVTWHANRVLQDRSVG